MPKFFSKEHCQAISHMNQGNKHGELPWSFQMMSIGDPIHKYVMAFKTIYANNRQLIKKHWQKKLARGEKPELTDLFEIEVKIRAKHNEITL